MQQGVKYKFNYKIEMKSLLDDTFIDVYVTTDLQRKHVIEMFEDIKEGGKVKYHIDSDKIKKEDCGGEMTSGGKAGEELNDIAWDIGLKNKWIVNDNWIDEHSRQKAFNLAKAELYHFTKGGKTGALDGVDWIITGKS
jgi:hypothetical protein